MSFVSAAIKVAAIALTYFGAQLLRSAERATYTSIGNFSPSRLSLMAVMVLALGTAAAAMVVPNRMWRRRSYNLLLFPIAVIIFCYSMVRSGALGRARGGIVWRGTFYSNEMLKEGRRFGSAWKDLEAFQFGDRRAGRGTLEHR